MPVKRAPVGQGGGSAKGILSGGDWKKTSSSSAENSAGRGDGQGVQRGEGRTTFVVGERRTA